MSQVAKDKDFLDYDDLDNPQPVDDSVIINMRNQSKRKVLGLEVGSKAFYAIGAAILGIAVYLYLRFKK